MNESPTLTPLTTDAGYRLEYVIAAETYYALHVFGTDDRNQIQVMKAADNGVCSWVFKVVDHIKAIQRPAIQVHISNETFAAFAELAPFFAALADRNPTTLGEVREILDGLGFTDATERVQPAR